MRTLGSSFSHLYNPSLSHTHTEGDDVAPVPCSFLMRNESNRDKEQGYLLIVICCMEHPAQGVPRNMCSPLPISFHLFPKISHSWLTFILVEFFISMPLLIAFVLHYFLYVLSLWTIKRKSVSLNQWFPALGNPGVLGLQFPQVFTTSCAGQGFLGTVVQEHLGYPRLSQIINLNNNTTVPVSY